MEDIFKNLVIQEGEEPDEKFDLITPDTEDVFKNPHMENNNFTNEQYHANHDNSIASQQNAIDNTFIKEGIVKYLIKQNIVPKIIVDPINGIVYYTLYIPNVYEIKCLPLLNVCNYNTFLYYCKYNKQQKILIVKCNFINDNLFMGENLCIVFNYDNKIEKKYFFQALINSGITFSSPIKYKDSFVNELLVYSIKNSRRIEIPYSYGWWKKSGKEWKFANKNDLTIKYIQENKTDQKKVKIPYENSYTAHNYTLNENKFLILISLAVNYPVLKEYGMELSKPLFIIVDKGQMKKAINILSDSDTPKLNKSIKKRELVKIMTETNSDFVVYPYIQSKENDKFLSTINDIIMISEIDGNKINAMPVIISENFPYRYDIENFFTVCIEGNLEDIQVDKIAVVPPEKDLAIVTDKIDNEIKNSFSHDKKVLMAAVYFLYPNFKNKIDYYKDLVELLTEENNNNYDANSLEYFFIEELFNWQKSTDFHNISKLPYPEDNALKNMEGTIFFDENYVYIHENTLKKITKKFENIININRLKKKLDDEGILYKENTNTYTVKMCYYKDGMLDRKRMLRFYRSKLYKKGVGFIEACQKI